MPDIQQSLLDFDATIKAKPNLTTNELMAKFPEFNNDPKLLQAAHDYSATLNAGKYDQPTLNSKFPEFFGQKTPMARPEEQNFMFQGIPQQQQAVNGKQEAKPLTDKEAKKTIYGGMPGVTKIGDVSILPTGGGYQNTKGKASVEELPTQTKEVAVPTQSVYGDAPQLKVQTITTDPDAPVNDYVPNEYEKAMFKQAQTISRGVTEQEFNPQFYKDAAQGAINSLAGIGGSSLKGIGDITSKTESLAGVDFFDSYGKKIQDLGEKASNYARKNSNYSPGQKIGGLLPLAGAAVADIASGGALTPAITGVFAASGYGDGLEMYDEVNKGKETNEYARTGAGLLYGAVMAGAANYLVGKTIPKGILSEAVQSVFKSNPELLRTGGEAVMNSFAKAQPSIVKQLMRNTLHGVGTMEAMDLSKNAIDEIYGKHHDLKDWINTATEAAVTGAIFSGLTSPFSIHAQSKANIERRNAQGQVAITFDEKGKPVEILSGNKGLTPEGKEVTLSENSLNNAYSMTTTDFNNALKQYATTGKATINERDVFSNKVAGTLTRLANNGNVTVARDENGNALYVIGKNNDGLMGMDVSGNVVNIPKESPMESANIADVHQSILHEYDKRNAFYQEPTYQQAISNPESIVNPTIPTDVDVMNPQPHIETGIKAAEAKRVMDEQLNGLGIQFDNTVLTLEPEAKKQVLADVMNDAQLNELQKQSIINYLSTTSKSIQLENAAQEALTTKLQQAQQQVEKSVNPTTGTVVTARIKGGDENESFPVISGLAVTKDESKQDQPWMVDPEKSEQAVYYKDADGKTQVTTADNMEVVSNATPYEQLAMLQEQYAQEDAMRQQAIQEGMRTSTSSVTTPKSPEGDLKSQVSENDVTNDQPVSDYTADEFVRLKDGTYGTITNVTPEGYEVTAENGTSKMVAESDILPETQLRGLSSGDTVSYTTSTGSVAEGILQIDPTLRKEGKILVNDEEINIDQLSTPKSPEGDLKNQVSENTGDVVDNVDDVKNTVDNTPQYPVLRDGTPDFNAMSDVQTFNYLKETEGEESAISAIKQVVKNTQNEIQTNNRAIDKFNKEKYSRTNKAKTLQAIASIKAGLKSEETKLNEKKVELEKRLEELNNLVSSKQSVVSSKQSAVKEPLSPKEEQENQVSENMGDIVDNIDNADAIKTIEPSIEESVPVREKQKSTQINPWDKRLQNLGEYLDVEDYVLRSIAGGMKFKWTGDGVNKGLGDELGLASSAEEKTARKGILSDDGITPQEFAHAIWDEYGGENNNGRIPGLDKLESQDILNFVLDVANSTQTKSEALKKSEEKHKNLDLNEEDYSIYQSFTPEELNYLEQIPDDILSSYIGITNFTPEQLDLITNLQNEYYANRQETTNNGQVDEQSASTGTGELSEGIANEEGSGSGEGTGLTQAERDTKELDDYIAEQAHNTNPTEKQKETGIYAKARVNLQHHNITIETLKGTERSGIDEGGQKWSVTMQNHYGELDGTIGYDGDPIDVFIGNNPKEGGIYVIDQITPANPSASLVPLEIGQSGQETSKFDESKVMLGFDSAEEAKAAYMSNYSEGWDGFSAITPAGEKFKHWLYDGKKQRKPFSEYVDTPDAVDASTSSATSSTGSATSEENIIDNEKSISLIPDSFTVQSFNDFENQFNNGEITLDAYKKAFEVLRSSKDAIISELNTKKKDELINSLSSWSRYAAKSEKKDRIVKAIYDDMLMTFTFGSIEYDFTTPHDVMIARKVARATQSDIDNHVAEVQKQRDIYKQRLEEFKKALTNPETLPEFKIFIDKNGIGKLSLEQKAKYDELVTDRTKEIRKQNNETQAQVSKVEGVSMSDVIDSKHTKTGAPLFVVKLNDRVDKDTYYELNSKAKKFGGSYSSYNKDGAIPGFQFKTREDAEKFKGLETENVSTINETTQEDKIQNRVSKLRDNANKMIEAAETELNRERLTNTSKRASEAGRMDERANEQKRIAQTMLNISDAIDRGDVKLLDGINAKTHIELLDGLIQQAKYKELNEKYSEYSERQKHQGEPATLETLEHLRGGYYPSLYVSRLKDLIKESLTKPGVKRIATKWEKNLAKFKETENIRLTSDTAVQEIQDMLNSSNEKYFFDPIKNSLADHKRLKAMGIENDSMLRSALREYIQYRGVKGEVDKVKQLERALVGKNVGIDFFPTPKKVVSEMLDYADIQEGMSVLEPSAGNGNIADAIKEQGIKPDVIEISNPLREVLSAKGYNLVGDDFMAFSGQKYDRIVMNPPFGTSTDIDHVLHAYDLLKQDGKLVAVMSESTFFRNDAKSVKFREFLDNNGSEIIDVDAGAFNDRTLLNTTGVKTRIVVIDKNDNHVSYQINPNDLIKNNVSLRDDFSTVEEKHADRVSLVREVEGSFGFKESYVPKDREDFIQKLSEYSVLNEREKVLINLGLIGGSETSDGIIINAMDAKTEKALATTILHENTHSIVHENFTSEDFDAAKEYMSELEPIYLNDIEIQNYNEDQKADEIMAYATQELLNKNSIQDIINGTVNYSSVHEQIQPQIQKIVNTIQNENNSYQSRNSTISGKPDGRRVSGTSTTFGKRKYPSRPRKNEGSDNRSSDDASASSATRDTIDIDGKQRSTTNSLGKPIHSTEEGIRNFWKWFGDSKAVDNSDRPLIVYRGTKTDQGSIIGNGKTPIFFTDNLEAAKNYANGMGFSKPENPTIIEAYLKTLDPKIEDFEGEEDNNVIWNAEDLIQSKENDGYFALNTNDGQFELNQYIVFLPTQIKSATGNDGSFSPDTSDIRYQIIGENGAEMLDASTSSATDTEASTRLNDLRVAKEMEATKTPQEIRLATDWEKGVDGKWRYEVADGKLSGTLTSEPVSLSEVWSDEQLFTAYPQLKEIQINVEPFNGKYSAMNFPDENKITVYQSRNGSIPQSANSFITHEIQHSIQEIEGFSLGSNIDVEIDKVNAKANNLSFEEYKDAISSFEKELENKKQELDQINNSKRWNKSWKAAGVEVEINKLKAELKKLVNTTSSEQEAFDNYRKSAGEVEARNVQSRLELTTEERRNTLLAETADVKPEEQRFDRLSDPASTSSLPESVTKPKYAASLSDYAAQIVKYNDEIKAIEDRKKELKKQHEDKQISNLDFSKEVKSLNEEKFDLETKVKRIEAGTSKPEDFASTSSATATSSATDGSTSSPTATSSATPTSTGSVSRKLAREAGNPITEKLRDELDNKMERGISKLTFAIQEAYQDQHIAVKHFQDVLINNGLKITPINDWYMRSTSLGGMNDSQMDAYEHRFNLPIMKEVNRMEKISSYRDIENYMMLKHGIERNEWMDRQRLIEWANNWKVSKIKSIEKPSDPLEMVDYDNKISKIDERYKERVALINKTPEEVEKHWNDWLEEKINKLNTNEKYKEIWLTSTSASSVNTAGSANATSSANATYADSEAVDEYAQKIENLTNQAKKRLEETKIDSTKDYSGITAIEEEVEIPAKQYIDEFEAKQDTAKFWDLINKSTKNACKVQFENGMIDKETFEDLKTRFQYYIPLRGFDKEIAEDKYDYSPDMGTHFVAPLIKAKGRTSRPETPFAYIFSMNHSAITQANKNNLNQAWVRLARQDKSGMLTLKQAWYKKVGETDDKQPIWEQQSPEWNADPEQYATNITKFEADMQTLADKGEAMQKRGKLDIGLFVKPKQAKQHEIHVFENGTEQVVYINANPKVARAINGDNRVEAGKFFDAISVVQRWMAANFTSRNPLFMATNLERDLTFATTTLGVKEGLAYQANFIKNIPVSIKAISSMMMGKGSVKNKYDQYAEEFVMNGGKTGYTHIVEIKQVQKRIEDEIKSGKVHEPSMIFKIFEVGNLVAENTTRLATYITSREAGRTIPEAVNNAKEVTVNFNRKGSGALGADEMRKSFLFFNVAVQALDNMVKTTKQHPWRMAGLLASFVATGILAPMLTQLLGGDEAEAAYNNLSEWDRQNNWCIWTGDGFVKWSLPQELRVFHSLGDNIYRSIQGKVSTTELAVNTMIGLTDLLPINPMGAVKSDGKEWKMLANSVTPDLMKPWVQLAINTTYTGGNVFNQYANNADPGYVQASKNKKGEPYAPAILVWAAQETDKLSGGDGVMPGKVSPNPDVINHLMRGYMGGLYSIFIKSVDSGDKLVEGKELKVRDTPLSALYTSKDDIKESDAGLRKEYNDIKAAISDEKHYISKYKSNAMDLYRKGGDIGKVAEYTARMATLSTQKYNMLKYLTAGISKLENEMKDAPNPDELAQKANEFKKFAVRINNAGSDEEMKAIQTEISSKQ